MASSFEVSEKDIKQLNQWQLVDLLRRLLLLEAHSHGIPKSVVTVSMNINAADGGEDGRIEWSGKPRRTQWIPNRLSMFQVKATSMGPSKCKKELYRDGAATRELKPAIEEVLTKRGAYVLFCNHSSADAEKKQIQAFREGLTEVKDDSFAKKADVHVFGLEKITKWTNDYPPAVTAVFGWLGLPVIPDAQTWEMWSGYEHFKMPFIEDDVVRKHINQLRSYFTAPRSVARIVGLSGLGKTRLALEAFRPSQSKDTSLPLKYIYDELALQTLSDQVVYFKEPSVNLKQCIVALRQYNVVLVVDNCEIQMHHELQNEVLHSESNLSLLTLDYDPEPEPNAPEYALIHLQKASNEVIAGVLRQAYPELPGYEIGHMVKMSDGFPQMAVLFANSHGSEGMFKLDDRGLIKKIIWGREPRDAEAERVLSACALFTSMGFSGSRTNERDYVASQICEVSTESFYRHTRHFIRRKILDQRGDFISVVPLPLALHLAEEWWINNCPPERHQEILTDESMPQGLVEAMANRFAMLDYLECARDAVTELCRDGRPFSRAEVLNTERGSRLYRSLVEVNPEAAVKALHYAFKDWRHEDLLQIGQGRRNLVGALEKLCFWESTFPEAARLLLSFGAAENETWSNNATGLFLRLFHLKLSGTQAAPAARFDVIDEALSSGIFEQRVLAVRALGKAMESNDFSRMAGVEQQGSRMPQQDWYPKFYDDIFNYYRSAARKLVEIACDDEELTELACVEFASKIYTLINPNLIGDLETAISDIVGKRGSCWPEALGTIQRALLHNKDWYDENTKSVLQKCMRLLQPQAVEEQLRLFVSIPPWAHVKGEDGHYIDIAQQKAESLARELAPSFESWKEHLQILMQGEQRKGYDFGYVLGECLVEEPEKFLEVAISTLASQDESGNPAVLGGFLAALHPNAPDIVSAVLDKVAIDELNVRHLAYLTACIKCSEQDLQRVVKAVNNGSVRVSSLLVFSYGKALQHLTPPVVNMFCESILQHGFDGAWTAINIIYMYCYGCYGIAHDWEPCHSTLRTIILAPNMTLHDSVTGHDNYMWAEVVRKLLDESDGDPEIAVRVLEVTLHYDDDKCRFNVEDTIHEVLSDVLAKYSIELWPVLGEALANMNDLAFARLRHLLHRETSKKKDSSVVERIPVEYLISWCKGQSIKTIARLADITPAFHNANGNLVWNPLAEALIEEYGTHLEVLGGLTPFESILSGSFDEIIMHSNSAIFAFTKYTEHRTPNVRRWAHSCIDVFQREINSYKKELEERKFGR